MAEDKKDGYETLEWIISQSEEGLFLAVAGEPRQKEIMAYFAGRPVGIYDKAEELYKQALRIREDVLGKEHPDAEETRKCIMRIYEKQGIYDKSL